MELLTASRPLRALAALLLAAAPLAAPAAPAAATPAPTPPAPAAAVSNPPGVHVLNGDGRAPRHTECPAGWVCLYDGAHFDHAAVALLPGTGITDTERLNLPDGSRFTGEEGVSAWINNSPVTYCWYPGKDYAGTAVTMAPATRGNAHGNALKSLRPC
ncbi:peptidase inhibitor family I36 protein [Kitasatospora phosalacinea]|uniref:peptidase inhibitor family I36 protein n=1 Tax=Kitasatospora phosalacinea TaxID=2065 RepID=UPI00068F8CAB|nr:peptidase inhibitor family I36 protein [Kitasatospora phosalacinea]